MLSYKDYEKYLFGCDHAEAVDVSAVDYVPATARRRLYIGSTGDVKIDTAGGETVTFKSVPVGFLDVHATKIYHTGTSASSIIALW